ncbi:MAG: tRNA lysidine(34) synthetase TilS [bacterium]|nr:tRNA lysidine(34) synthetase TilS [bacterium]
MDKLVQHIDTVLINYQPKRLLVACSAGLDSTVLLHACSKLNYPVEIAHVNYQLRGQESEGDQRFLESLSQKLSVPIHIKRIDLNTALKEGGNLQEKARQERYAYFESLRAGEKDTLILLAHHKEDQTETFFMNVARNSGVMGLAAMPEKRGNYIRPLLSISKEELRDFATKNGIIWREDTSNQSLKYTRNEWRNTVLPELRKAIPSLDDSVEILTKSFQEKQTEITKKIQSVVNEIRASNLLSFAKFQELDEHERIELCRQISQPIGIAETWKNLNHKGTGIELTPTSKFPYHKMVFDGTSYSFLSEKGQVEWKLKTEKVDSLPRNFNKAEIYLDPNSISGTLRLRSVQRGDRIHPVGMKGSRLVSDVISDHKLTGLEKQALCVLVDDKHVLWLPKLCISRKAIASETSSEILKVSLESIL